MQNYKCFGENSKYFDNKKLKFKPAVQTFLVLFHYTVLALLDSTHFFSTWYLVLFKFLLW